MERLTHTSHYHQCGDPGLVGNLVPPDTATAVLSIGALGLLRRVFAPDTGALRLAGSVPVHTAHQCCARK